VTEAELKHEVNRLTRLLERVRLVVADCAERVHFCGDKIALSVEAQLRDLLDEVKP